MVRIDEVLCDVKIARVCAGSTSDVELNLLLSRPVGQAVLGAK